MIYVFGDCELDTHLYTLRRDGQTQRLQRRVYNILMYLLEHRDHVVSKDELCEQIWPEQFISNSTLESAMRLVRQAVGDSGRSQRIIETARGHGYRFVADVVEHPDIQASLITTPTPPAASPPQDLRPALGPVPFVGRQRELAMLHELLEQAEIGQGRIAALTGIPGMGKSQLLKTFCQGLRKGRVTSLNGSCLFNRTAKPYLPMLSIVRQSCGILLEDSAETMTTKVYRHWQDIGLDANEGVSYLLHLLGVEASRKQLVAVRPELIRTRTVIAICRMLLASCRQRPLLIAIEDLDWIDSASEACLSSLTDHFAHAPILILTTCRPAYQLPWMDKPFATHLPLSPLTARDGLSMVESMLTPDHLPASLEQTILTTASGHPLCLDALIRLVAEQGAPTAQVILPDNFQDILSARMAQLPDGPKRLLQTAAVLGSSYSGRLLEAVWEGPDDLDACLSELERRFYFTVQDNAGEPVYALTHELIQEEVYNRLSHARLQALHTSVGQALEVVYASRLETISDLLAHHYLRTEQDDKAIRYLTLLAETAAQHGLHSEAIAALQVARTRVDGQPGEQPCHLGLDLALRHGQSLFAMRRWQETVTLLTQHQVPWDQLQDLRLESHYSLLLSRAYKRLEQWEVADRQAQHALDAATRHRDAAVMGQAYHVLAEIRYGSESFSEGMAMSQRAVDLLTQAEERVRLGKAHLVLGLNALFFGDFERALHASEQARTIGNAVDDPHLPSFADWLAGWAQATCGRWEEGIQACQRSLENAPDPLSAAFAQGWLGYAYLERGETDEAIPLLKQSAQQMHQLQHRRSDALYTTFLGETYLLCHDLNTARDWICQGLTIARETSYHTGVAWATRALGRLDQASNALAASEQHLQEALDMFETLQLRFEVGRTHLDLARLMHLRDNSDAAATHVIEASNMFRRLQVPAYIDHAQLCARKLGLPSFP